MKNLFLPIDLLLAVGAACVVPAPGAWLRTTGAVPFLVFTIFLVNGWTVRLRIDHLDRRFALAFATACCLSLLPAPFLGAQAAAMVKLDPMVATGLIVMSSVPVTLSSAIVITEVSGATGPGHF